MEKQKIWKIDLQLCIKIFEISNDTSKDSQYPLKSLSKNKIPNVWLQK